MPPTTSFPSQAAGRASSLTVGVSLLVMLSGAPARAGCSRPIVVPASALGRMMVANPADGQVGGVYPELLRERGRQVGCEFVFPVMPRIRAEMLVASGEADLLVGAVNVPERDVWGYYVPMIGTEWLLVSQRGVSAPDSIDALLARPGIRFNAVRSFNYGPAYQALLAQLDKLGKLEYVVDTATIVRKMLAGRADYTFMPSNTFAGALDDMGLRDSMGPKIQYTRLAGMPTSTSGVYISRKLPQGDRALLLSMLTQLSRDGALLARTGKYFTAAEMASSFALPKDK